MMARYRPSGDPHDEGRQDRRLRSPSRREGVRAESRPSRPKKGTAIPVLLKSRSPCIATIAFGRERAQDRQRRSEAPVDRNLGDAGALACRRRRARSTAGEDVGDEHDVDRLPDLGEHQAADLPVAQVRRQQQHALALLPRLEDPVEPDDALDEPRTARPAASRSAGSRPRRRSGRRSSRRPSGATSGESSGSPRIARGSTAARPTYLGRERK